MGINKHSGISPIAIFGAADECQDNTLQYNMMFHTALQNIHQSAISQITPHISPWWASCEVYFEMIQLIIDQVIMAPHCIILYCSEVCNPFELDTCRCNLQLSDLQMICSDLTFKIGHQDHSHSNGWYALLHTKTSQSAELLLGRCYRIW